MSRVIILMYHIVDEPLAAIEGKYCCPPGRFDEQMRWLRASGRRLLSLDELAACIDRRAPVEDGSVAVTFDDGFEATVRNAVPVLARYKVPATMFLLSDRFDMRTLMLYRFPDGPRIDIARLHSPKSRWWGEIRCDLHPRWDRSGRRVCIDSVHDGSRQMYVLDIGSIVR